MYKNILVITDNYELASAFKKMTEDKKFNGTNFSFATSPFSDIKLFNSLPNIEVFDLKEQTTINNIINVYDLVFSIHCKQIFPSNLVDKVKCINVHPGYNPINRGWYPQVFAIIKDLEIGATIHEIDHELDHGKIIDREFVQKDITDTSLSLYKKITSKELELLKKNLYNIVTDNYLTQDAENDGNLFLKKDFNNLREIDLNEKTTALELINKLRALTHGEFKNAFFRDPDSQKKIFISVNLISE